MTRSIDLESPCIDAGFGYMNTDGYVRIADKPRNEGGKLVMRHRWFWETFVGPIPGGCEIDHMCKNRRCFNVKHLQVLASSEHRSKDNRERYAKDFESFKEFYLANDGDIGSQKEVGKHFGRCQGGISKWVKCIKQEETN